MLLATPPVEGEDGRRDTVTLSLDLSPLVLIAKVRSYLCWG